MILTGEPQTPKLAITTKANLIFVASTLFTRIATPKILCFNCGVILEGRKTSIKFLRKLRLFDCISQKDLNNKTTTLTRKPNVLR